LRILIIGIDGASPKLIEEWKNDLPYFRRFMEEGCFGRSIPPCPAQTPVAWTTFLTGKNPGKHGIFSFISRSQGSYQRQITHPEQIRSKTLFHILNDFGKKVGSINVPLSTYSQGESFMIPGFLDKYEGIPRPDRIAKKLEKRFGLSKFEGDLDIEVLRQFNTNPDKFFESVERITEQQLELCLFLMKEEPWDLFMTVFMGLDRIQHFFWKYIDRDHPGHVQNRFSQKFKKSYQILDQVVGELLKNCEKDDIIILISDHGFCPVYKEIILNNYLQEEGFLQTRDGKVDLERSKAVSYGYGDIWLNVKGREPNGIVEKGKDYEFLREKIVDILEKLSIDNTKPVKKVMKRESLYWGELLKEAPDLITYFNVGWQSARRPEIVETRADRRYVGDNPLWSGGHDGTHDPVDVPGIFGVLSPNIYKNMDNITIHLCDLAPTILKIMCDKVPMDMDGTVVPILSKD
jgi:predicted AlkP superfamily phosphohydrolase/phosphomutase